MLSYAIAEGRNARANGKSLRDNPYDYYEQKDQSVSWAWGWERALPGNAFPSAA